MKDKFVMFDRFAITDKTHLEYMHPEPEDFFTSGEMVSCAKIVAARESITLDQAISVGLYTELLNMYHNDFDASLRRDAQLGEIANILKALTTALTDGGSAGKLDKKGEE